MRVQLVLKWKISSTDKCVEHPDRKDQDRKEQGKEDPDHGESDPEDPDPKDPDPEDPDHGDPHMKKAKQPVLFNIIILKVVIY